MGGIESTLADTVSGLINIDPRVQQDSEPEGYEFGCCMFGTFPVLETSGVETTQDASVDVNDNNIVDNNLLEFPMDNDMLFRLQQKDKFCANILAQMGRGSMVEGQLYKIKDKLLKRYVVDGNNTYETIVLLGALAAQMLRVAYDDLGHSGTHVTYTLLRRLCCWGSLKPCVTEHIQRCYRCQGGNKQVVGYATLHFNVATFLVQFISVDLIGGISSSYH